MTVRSLKAVAAAAAVFLVLGAAGCSSNDSSTSTTTTEAATASTTSTTSKAAEEATIRFDKEIQSQLAAVGCYKGNIDGIVGPATDAAIVEFQKASGLTADGELGAKTEAALNSAVAAKKTVCGSTTTTTATPAPTTTFAPNDAPCTATAIRAGLGGDSADPAGNVTSYVCSGGYAAGSIATGAKFILVAQNGKWTKPSQDPCGTASAGLPPIILEDGCAA